MKFGILQASPGLSPSTIRSRVLMAFYSLNYAHSRACQWELTAGFLAAQREGDPRQRVLIVNPEEMAEHIHPVELG